MIVHVDLATDEPVVELKEPDDCRRFHVEARGGVTGLGEALQRVGVGRVLPSGDALIEIDSVRRLAAGRVPEDWDARFDAMLDYARGKGWVDEDGRAIQAHVEWQAPPGG